MSAVELTKLRARTDALEARATAAEARLEEMFAQQDRLEQTIAALKKEHEDMMQAKADCLRSSVLAEIRGNAEVVRRELIQSIHETVRQQVKLARAGSV